MLICAHKILIIAYKMLICTHKILICAHKIKITPNKMCMCPQNGHLCHFYLCLFKMKKLLHVPEQRSYFGAISWAGV